MNLDALNLAEQELLSRVQRVTGLMEEKHSQLQQSGVYAEYGKIYEAYVQLIKSENEGLEALKRSIFLLWYEQAEPSCFSGLFGLSEIASQKVFSYLERRAEAEDLDFELKWMLPYYDMIAEWMFDKCSNIPNLQAFLATSDSNSFEKLGIKSEDFVGRGQMGNYWTSVLNSNAVRFNENAS